MSRRATKSAVPADAFTKIDDIYAGDTKNQDRIALRLISKGEPVLRRL